METSNIDVLTATTQHQRYIPDILAAIYQASKVKGNSIVMCDPDYLALKMEEGKAVIALRGEDFVGFCYLESWQGGKFVANSGMIVRPEYRGQGVATRIKAAIVQICRTKFPMQRDIRYNQERSSHQDEPPPRIQESTIFRINHRSSLLERVRHLPVLPYPAIQQRQSLRMPSPPPRIISIPPTGCLFYSTPLSSATILVAEGEKSYLFT